MTVDPYTSISIDSGTRRVFDFYQYVEYEEERGKEYHKYATDTDIEETLYETFFRRDRDRGKTHNSMSIPFHYFTRDMHQLSWYEFLYTSNTIYLGKVYDLGSSAIFLKGSREKNDIHHVVAYSLIERYIIERNSLYTVEIILVDLRFSLTDDDKSFSANAMILYKSILSIY